MNDHILKTIEDAKADLLKRELAVREAKRFINQLCRFGQIDMMYPDAEGDALSLTSGPVTTRKNAFYGQPLATCVREILEARKNSPHREATLDEIFNALRAGSYDLPSISKDEDGQRRGVAISMAKNSSAFHKLPNGDWGLTEWYPNVKKPRVGVQPRPGPGNGDSDETDDDVDVPEETPTPTPAPTPPPTPEPGADEPK